MYLFPELYCTNTVTGRSMKCLDDRLLSDLNFNTNLLPVSQHKVPVTVFHPAEIRSF